MGWSTTEFWRPQSLPQISQVNSMPWITSLQISTTLPDNQILWWVMVWLPTSMFSQGTFSPTHDRNFLHSRWRNTSSTTDYRRSRQNNPNYQCWWGPNKEGNHCSLTFTFFEKKNNNLFLSLYLFSWVERGFQLLRQPQANLQKDKRHPQPRNYMYIVS